MGPRVSGTKMRTHGTGAAAVLVVRALTLMLAVGCPYEPVESAELPVPHESCKCTNATTEIKCVCIDDELTKVPDNLPTPLHELYVPKSV